ncbi:MAG: hypothetical protein A2792_00145 [Sphingomonadales bacterium RIFCSPHIGHO2_01_FULL_65_20]|nr:MAG: hypothetical protein A2792_00145 [Sphingomonadales bacterium RIFCSPHIGHO2_01_FULL_65_20]
MAAAPEDIPFDPSALIRIGVIATVDLGAATCTVTIGDPDEDPIETPPLRWLAPRAGDTRVWSPPTVGEQAIVLCAEGELAAGIVLLGIVQTAFPPAGDSLAELIAFADGAVLQYDPEGHELRAELPAGSIVHITADQVHVVGNVSIDGDLTITGTATADVDVVGGGKSLKDHKHLGVTAGGGVSGKPE